MMMKHEEKDPAMEVLQEIKALMDHRMGNSLKAGHGLQVEKVSVIPGHEEGEESPEEEAMETPAMEASENEGGEGEESPNDLTPEEEDQLRQIYHHA